MLVDQRALAGEHEEPLLHVLRVVQGTRVARPHHPRVDADGHHEMVLALSR